MSTKITFPPPLANPRRHPLLWLGQLVLLLGASLVLVHIGKLIIIGLYYIAFQTIPAVKHLWDTLFSGHLHLLSQPHWDYWRHLLRNVYEGILGGLLGQGIVWNPYKKKNQKTMAKQRNALDKLEDWLHIPNLKNPRRVSGPQYAMLPLLVTIYAAPGFGIGAGVVYLGQHAILHTQHFLGVIGAPHAAGALAGFQNMWSGPVSQSLIGLFASFVFARRVGKAYYHDLQLHRIERRCALHEGKERRWDLPPFKARLRIISGPGNQTWRSSELARSYQASGTVPVLLALLTFAGILLAGFGYYVVTYIALKH